MSYIEFKQIVKKYGDNTVLKNVDLKIEKGEFVTLLGPSGCGKSTLLRCLAGLEEVTEGQIIMDGKDITHVDPRERGIGMVFQQYSLFPNMTVEKNVAFGLKLMKMEKSMICEKVNKMLAIVGLSEKKDAYPSQLSGGQQQRAALARALVTEPKVLLLDEPLSAIDALLRKSLQIEIKKIQQELGITAIFVTHDQEEAMVISDKIHLIYQGDVEQSGTPEEIYTQPKTKFAANFIGDYNILSKNTFFLLTGEKIKGNDIAFRPEIVQISHQKTDNESKYYSINGVIERYLPHGNTLRYEIRCNRTILIVDVLFQNIIQFGINENVVLNIEKEECINLDK